MTGTSATTVVADMSKAKWWAKDIIPEAEIYRWAWMRFMGHTDDEIDESMEKYPPVNSSHEFDQLKAMHAVYLLNKQRRGEPQ